MFTLFTASEFGRGFALSDAEKTSLSSYLAAYRRNRAKVHRQASAAIVVLPRAA